MCSSEKYSEKYLDTYPGSWGYPNIGSAAYECRLHWIYSPFLLAASWIHSDWSSEGISAQQHGGNHMETLETWAEILPEAKRNKMQINYQILNNVCWKSSPGVAFLHHFAYWISSFLPSSRYGPCHTLCKGGKKLTPRSCEILMSTEQ